MSGAAFHAGGCQCGAVRFRVHGRPPKASVCYCRMCQKASSSHAFPLVDTRGCRVEWSRGEPSWFRSSNLVRRGFCSACGTPLAYDAPDGLALALVAFDDPAAFPPSVAFGVEGKLPWCDAIPALLAIETMDDIPAAPFLADLVSRQHPDHETENWPPEEER